jgi:hypothetical protein
MSTTTATPYTDYLTERLGPALSEFLAAHARFKAASDQADAAIDRALRETPGISRSDKPYLRDALRKDDTFAGEMNALRPAWETALSDFEKAWRDGQAISEAATEEDLASARAAVVGDTADGDYRLTLTKTSQDWIAIAVIVTLTGGTFDQAATVQKSIQHIGPAEVVSGVTLDQAVDVKTVLESLEGFALSISEGPPPGTYKRHSIPESVRHEVWRRDGGACVDCGSRERLEFDHIVPVSKGGANTARNIELRCQDCNRSKAAKI